MTIRDGRSRRRGRRTFSRDGWRCPRPPRRSRRCHACRPPTDLAVTPGRRRHQTATGAGPPERCDLLIDLCCLNEILEHVAGDLVVRVQAGVTIESLAESPPAEARSSPSTSRSPAPPIGGTLATATRRPPQVPVRHAPRPADRHHGRAGRRHDRPVRRQGRQERRGLRPGQTLHRLVRHARASSPRPPSASTPSRRIVAGSRLPPDSDPDSRTRGPPANDFAILIGRGLETSSPSSRRPRPSRARSSWTGRRLRPGSPWPSWSRVRPRHPGRQPPARR